MSALTVIKSFFSSKEKKLNKAIAERNQLLLLETQLFSPKKGIGYVNDSLYNFLINNYKSFSLNKFDLITGMRVNNRTKNSTVLNQLFLDCLMLEQSKYYAKYNTMVTYLGDNEKRYFGDWFDNELSINEVFEVYLPALMIIYNYDHREYAENDNQRISCNDYTKEIEAMDKFKNKYPGAEAFIQDRDYITLLIESIRVLIAIYEIKIRSLGGDEI